METLTFLLIYGIVFFVLWFINQTATHKKVIGSAVISYGIINIMPLPGPNTIWLMPLYLKAKGLQLATLSASNLSEYLIWEMVRGIVIVLIGMKVADVSLDKIRRKIGI